MDGTELALIDRLSDELSYHATRNIKKTKLYDGKHFPATYDIAIPPSFQGLKAVLGWSEIIIDVLEQRLDFFGYTDPDDLGLNAIYADNQLEVEQSVVHHDALLYGTGFVVVGRGDAGEPQVLITPESPSTMTGIYNKRYRRLDAAYSVDTESETAMLYLPNVSVYLDISQSTPREISRDEHRLGRVPVVRFDNRTRSNGTGKSELSEAVEYLSDAAARTALRMEIASAAYSSPREVILGGDKNLLAGQSQWSSYLGRVRHIPWDEDEDSKTNPSMIQLSQADPTPFIEQIDLFATQLAGAVGFPKTYLGVTESQPTSADAIKAGEIRLVKRAERRQKVFSQAWLEVARLALLIRDGELPDLTDVSPRWQSASSPTRAATADALTKLVGAGVIPATSEVVLDELDLTPAQRETIKRERTEASSRALVENLAMTRTNDG